MGWADRSIRSFIQGREGWLIAVTVAEDNLSSDNLGMEAEWRRGGGDDA
jgi:hypothetical protein